MRPTYIVLIPAYQPTESLLEILKEAKSVGFQLIVINDGSNKEKDALFVKTSKYATILEHNQNRGKGRAIKTGLAYIQSNYPLDSSVVVTMDADGQHRVADAMEICRVAWTKQGALILGSRRLKKNVPLRSQLGNTITRFVYHILTRQKVRDTQTGLRAFHGQMLPFLLSIPGERYEYEMNVLLACAKNKIPIIEEEIATIYFDDNAASHFDAVKDSYRIYKEILKFSASSLSSFIVDYGLFSLLTALTSGMESRYSLLIANIGARLVSASVNYTMNRRLVFQSNALIAKSALQYAVLAASILAANTLILHILVDLLSTNRYIAKLITEILFFFVSWLMQRKFIFRREKTNQK